MSAVEETLERIKQQPGVQGYVISNHEGVVLRRLPSMSQSTAEQLAESMRLLSSKARNVVRDLDPQSELRNFRIRTKDKKEVMVSYDREFIVVVVQDWMPAESSDAIGGGIDGRMTAASSGGGSGGGAQGL
eukprot:CAMPEP_0172498806 /NCGR_PEP_ID=MMETSP1066-20121228/117676_1 /TAXON_ID=671091 /ORGANISM="Coscinodiscus wailesii, Strain CCMP2513" /LENGTH=130 /DNA_ID=CAMNT_0013272235 /DNA_START=98 /DNA_END=490 /DNA_ORIENTATION=-